jgi:hypothetical protein
MRIEPTAGTGLPQKVSSGDAFERARRKFLHKFPSGFRDETYLDWERNYKWEAHQEWNAALAKNSFRAQLGEGAYQQIAAQVVKIESGRSLLFSFEKMALRDAVRSLAGAKLFSEGLFAFLHGKQPLKQRFEDWVQTVEQLPRKQTRVLTWPVVTVFGFIAQPDRHIFLKPNTTKEAARKLGLPFAYQSRANWDTYRSYLAMAEATRKRIRDLRPRDMIDVQSFLWVQGSDEYR